MTGAEYGIAYMTEDLLTGLLLNTLAVVLALPAAWLGHRFFYLIRRNWQGAGDSYGRHAFTPSEIDRINALASRVR